MILLSGGWRALVRLPRAVTASARVTVFGDGLRLMHHENAFVKTHYFDAASKTIFGWRLLRTVLVLGAIDRRQAVELCKQKYVQQERLLDVRSARVRVGGLGSVTLDDNIHDGRKAEVELRWE